MRDIGNDAGETLGLVSRDRMSGPCQRAEIRGSDREGDDRKTGPAMVITRSPHDHEHRTQCHDESKAERKNVAEYGVCENQAKRLACQRLLDWQAAHYDRLSGEPRRTRRDSRDKAPPRDREKLLVDIVATVAGTRGAKNRPRHTEHEHKLAEYQHCGRVVDGAKNDEQRVHRSSRRIPGRGRSGSNIEREVTLADVGVHRQHTPSHAVGAG